MVDDDSWENTELSFFKKDTTDTEVSTTVYDDVEDETVYDDDDDITTTTTTSSTEDPRPPPFNTNNDWITICCSVLLTGRGAKCKSCIGGIIYNNKGEVLFKDNRYLGENIPIDEVHAEAIVTMLNKVKLPIKVEFILDFPIPTGSTFLFRILHKKLKDLLEYTIITRKTQQAAELALNSYKLQKSKSKFRRSPI